MIVREATLEDAGLVAGVLEECTTRYLDRPSTVEDGLGRLRQSARPGDALLVLGASGEALGFGHLWEAPGDEVRCYVRVRPSAKGQGIATAILAQLVPRARELSRSVLTLRSWAQDRDDRRLPAEPGA